MEKILSNITCLKELSSLGKFCISSVVNSFSNSSEMLLLELKSVSCNQFEFFVKDCNRILQYSKRLPDEKIWYDNSITTVLRKLALPLSSNTQVHSSRAIALLCVPTNSLTDSFNIITAGNFWLLTDQES